MKMVLVDKPVKLGYVEELARRQFGNLIKAVVDVHNGLMALGGELHADEEQLLLEKGSSQADLWGINLYPEKFGSDDFIEYDSMINLRPSQRNMSRGVDDPVARRAVRRVVDNLVVQND
jgi:hypothetical protein